MTSLLRNPGPWCLLFFVLLFAGLPAQAQYHAADRDADASLNLSELLRVVQLYNAGGYSCAAASEDGYQPGVGESACERHSADYESPAWEISLSELLRCIQLYQTDDYHTDCGSEDGFAPEMGLMRRCSGDYQCRSWWTQSQDVALDESPSAVLPLDSGGAVVLSGVVNQIPPNVGQLLTQAKAYDECGVLLWEQIYTSFSNDFGKALVPAPEGGYIIGGYRYGGNVQYGDFLLTKISTAGEQEWQQCFETNTGDFALQTLAAPEGGYLMVGSINDYEAFTTSWLLLKADAEGNLEWRHACENTGCFDEAVDAVYTPSGEILVLGYSYDCNYENMRIQLGGFSAAGESQFRVTIGEAGSNLPESICRAHDNNYLIAGASAYYGGAEINGYLIKVTPEGQILWARTYGDTVKSMLKTVVSLPDGRIRLAGIHGPLEGYDTALWFLETDAEGRLIREEHFRPFGGFSMEQAFAFTAEGAPWVYGRIGRSLDGAARMLCAKFNEDGSIF